jgi:serine/threonine-protein kinase
VDDTFQKLQELFEAALAVPITARGDFVRDRCGDDDALRETLLRLLDADARAAERSGPLGQVVQDAVRDTVRDLREGGAAAGQLLGPYRLIREIGRGGMGTVWLAERADEAYQAQVAIKMVRGALFDSDLLARFRSERQILAQLQHPAIARLLDGGETADGTPYLVMEYVAGESLTAYATRARLPLRERLHCFLRVCEAVQYAHASLVVHRDIKPSNILVGTDGAPRLLDFGIAKPLASSDPETTLLSRRLTPAYASPEQLRGERLTVATDVYSLGVVLYELLAGQPPFSFDGSASDQVQHRVLAEEPRPPSDVLRQGAVPAGERGAPGPVRTAEVAGDLDNIVARAMRKEPAQRYGSVEQLAADVTRHLQGIPVLARPATVGYRARRFVQRNAAAVAGASLLVLSLTGGLAATLWQARAAERARLAAEDARARADEVKDFLLGLFRGADPRLARGNALTVRTLLDSGVARIDGLADRPGLQAEVLSVLGDVHVQIGEYRRAAELQARELPLRRRLGVDSSLVDALNRRAIATSVLGFPDSSLALLEEALPLSTASLGDDAPYTLATVSNLAVIYGRVGRYADALRMMQRLVETERRTLEPNDPERTFGLNNLGLALTRSGRYDEAEPLLRESLQLLRESRGDDYPDTAFGYDNLALMLREAGRFGEADSLARRALALRLTVLGESHPRTADSRTALAALLIQRNAPADRAEADSLLRLALEVQRDGYGPSHPSVAYTLYWQGVLALRSGDLPAAAATLRSALAILRSATRDDPRETGRVVLALAEALRPSAPAEGDALLREGAAVARERLPEGDPIRSRLEAALASSATTAPASSSRPSSPSR